MFCSACRCEYESWFKKCPVCRQSLTRESGEEPHFPDPLIPYEELVDRARGLNGLEVRLETTEMCRMSTLRFPWLGHGFAWRKRVEGMLDELPVDLRTVHVVFQRKVRFPYLGYGFAWTRKMLGHIGGHRVALESSRIETESQARFPYRGYGFAWTSEMKGVCGADLQLLLTASETNKEKDWGFPYQGYGYAWGKTFLLKFSLADDVKVGRGRSNFEPIAEFSSASFARRADSRTYSGMETLVRKLDNRPADSWVSTTMSS